MDPLGFALENFDAIGRWRTTEADDYRWSSLILGIVESTPFRMRRTEP